MASSKSSSKSRKPRPFASVRVEYAQKLGTDDVTKASKRLRAKIRGAYGKDPVITKWIDRHNKDNRDGNRYGPVTSAEAKALLNL